MAAKVTVLGVDLGTQSIKTVVYEPFSRTVLQTASHPLELISRDDGTREQLAEWWVMGLQHCMERLDGVLKAKIVAIGISGQQHGFVPVAEDGHVLAPAKLWCDTSSVTECDEIIDFVGLDRCRDITGCITAGFTAPKLRWFKKNNPSAYAMIKTVMLPHDYLNFFLTGERAMECGDASGTGVLDVRSRCWSREMLRAVDGARDLSSCFPRLIEPFEAVGKVKADIAARFGLSSNVLVSAGGGDNMMAAIGTGNVHKGCLTASIGTSGTLFAYSARPVIEKKYGLAAFCSSTGGWLPLLCTMNCTVATEQLRELFSLGVDKIDSLTGAIAPGCNGVLTLPFYNGERTPDLPKGKAVIFGLDMSNTTQGHLLRSAMEAAVFGLKGGLLAFKDSGMEFQEVTVTGGGSASNVWRQICADVLGVRVRVLREKENAAVGAALQALWCYGHRSGKASNLQDICREQLVEDTLKACLPNPETVAVYEDVYARYTDLLEAMKPLFK